MFFAKNIKKIYIFPNLIQYKIDFVPTADVLSGSHRSYLLEKVFDFQIQPLDPFYDLGTLKGLCNLDTKSQTFKRVLFPLGCEIKQLVFQKWLPFSNSYWILAGTETF